jgi:excisionase family DNA binding protein
MGDSVGNRATNTPADPPNRSFLTVSEVATILRVSKMTIYRLTQDGALESIRVGRSIRIPRTAVTTYLDSVQHDR